MRWVAIALTTLCACDKLLGLHATGLADGAPGSNPAACWPIAMPPMPPTPPAFLPTSHQVSTTSCFGYVPSRTAGAATAICSFASGGGPAYGPIDSDLATLSFTPYQAGRDYAQALLVPEGNEVWIHTTPLTTILPNDEVDIYTLANAVASYSRTIAFPTTFPINGRFAIGASALGRRFVYTDANNNPAVLHELIEDGTGNVTEVSGSFLAITGIYVVGPVNLSSDGLHAVFQAYASGPAQLYYTERSAPDDAFAAPVVLGDVPGVYSNPYLTDDCGRLYYDSNTVVSYLTEAT